jgi:hypothetical protein
MAARYFAFRASAAAAGAEAPQTLREEWEP